MSSKFNSIEYLNCPNPHHKKQLMISVCVDKECANRALICYLCEKESHPGHQTLTLGEYLNQLDASTPLEPDPGAQQVLQMSLEKIRTTRTKCFESLTATQEQVTSIMKGIESTITEFFDEKEKGVMDIIESYDMRVGKGFTYNYKKKVEKIMDEFKRQLRYIVEDKKFEQIYFEEVEKMVKTSKVREKELELTLDTVLYYLTETVRKDSQFTGISNMTVQDFRLGIQLEFESPKNKSKSGEQQHSPLKGLNRWSRTFKHSDIELTGTQAKRSLESMKLRHVGVLMEGSVDDAQMETLLIKQKSCGIIIGICLQSKAKHSGFVKEDWGAIGHGHYAVANDGLIWSHSDRTVNYKVKGFRFGTGDEIQVYYKKGVHKLEFTKNGGQEKWQLDIQPAPEGDCYRICVYMFMKGDSVCLVQRKNA